MYTLRHYKQKNKCIMKSKSINNVINGLLDIYQNSNGRGIWAQERCDYYYIGDKTAIIAMDAVKLFISTEDVGVATHIITQCDWEGWETNLVDSIIRPDQVWVEIGANLGYYTANIGNILRDQGRLYAFEASGELYQLLSKTVSVNGLDNTVDLIHTAVWNHDKGLDFCDSNKEFVGGSHISYSSEDAGCVHSTSTTLDIALKGQKVDVLKMDVEGAECTILDGAQSMLASSENLSIIMEWNVSMQTKAGSSVQDCMNNLVEHGFNHFYDIMDNTEVTVEYLVNTDKHMDIYVTKSPISMEEITTTQVSGLDAEL